MPLRLLLVSSRRLLLRMRSSSSRGVLARIPAQHGRPMPLATLMLVSLVAGCSLPRPPITVQIEGDALLTYPQMAVLEVRVRNTRADELVIVSWKFDDVDVEVSPDADDEYTVLARFPAPGPYRASVAVEVEGVVHTATHDIEVLASGSRRISTLTHVGTVATGFDEATQVPYPIPSTDPAGIVYYPPTAKFLLSDSEINEIPEVMAVVQANFFEIDLVPPSVERSWHLGEEGDSEVPDLEPTGIAYCQTDGHIYVTNDDLDRVARYRREANGAMHVVDWISTRPFSGDPEGATCDPDTGHLFVVAGSGSRILVYVYRNQFVLKEVLELTELVDDPMGIPSDPEGIAFDPVSRHLFIVSDPDAAIFEYTVAGEFVGRFDVLKGLNPRSVGAQGIAFGPSMQAPHELALYVADGGYDNDSVPTERDGFVFEFHIQRGE